MKKEVANGSRAQAAINVTPLVDVCLVLLIIFMVVAPMLREVKLPRGANPERFPEKEGRIVLALRSDGTLWYRRRLLPPEELLPTLRELRARAPGREVVLLADERLSFADVRRTMRVTQEAGFSGVSLAARREKTP